MFDRTDWAWVRRWCVQIFVAALALGTFLSLTALPVIRPGGVVQSLPFAVLVGLGVAVVATAVAAVLLGRYSSRKGGRHTT